MHRIDTPTAQIDKFGPGKNGFTNGDPATGRRATDLNSDMWDAVQEEMANAIEGNGIALDKSKHNQLYLAIQKAITDPGFLKKANNLADVKDKAEGERTLVFTVKKKTITRSFPTRAAKSAVKFSQHQRTTIASSPVTTARSGATTATTSI